MPASKKDAGLIGVELGVPASYGASASAVGTFVHRASGQVMKESVVAVWQRFSPCGDSQSLRPGDQSRRQRSRRRQTGARPESIYGAVRTATQGVQAGWADFLLVLVVINVFIGLLNLLPDAPARRRARGRCRLRAGPEPQGPALSRGRSQAYARRLRVHRCFWRSWSSQRSTWTSPSDTEPVQIARSVRVG